MIRFKNHNGFTLIEVLISVALIGIIMISIFALESTMFRAIVRWSHRVERMLHVVPFIARTRLDTQQSEKKEAEKEIRKPKTAVRYSRADLPKESSLGALQGLEKEEVALSWTEFQTKRSDAYVAFVYNQKKLSS